VTSPRIYTRTGDEGETGLPGGVRVPKDELRPETCGAVDELNTVLGLVRSEPLPPAIDQTLERIQHELFAAGAELASADPSRLAITRIGPQHVERMEREIDHYQQQLPALTEFILPGGTRAAALLHLARAVCRRAERRLVTLARKNQPPIAPALTVYLNRLGDLLFVLARAANASTGRADMPWRKNV
jgi:cob(I)alamin adenosyltransferase